MGRKGFNWKARQVVKTVIDDSKTKKIELEIDGPKTDYDNCNALVLPSKKRKTKVKKEKVQITRILSKKQRKHLEKIVEKKKKKENRATLLDALSKVQASETELKQLTSIASVQTKGLKKYFQEQNAEQKPKRKFDVIETDAVVNSIAGSKRKRVSLINSVENKYDTSDPNIVGFEQSDSDTESETDENETKVDQDEITPEMNGKPAETKEESAETKEEPTEKKEKPAETNEKPIEKSEKTSETNKKESPKTESKTEEKSKVVKKKHAKKEIKLATFITVNRTKEIQQGRLKLPILAEEQQIMETINENPVVLIAGETGSGKTTQVPQFIYEAGYAQKKMIAITEPRRVAAIAMSKRVSEEMNLTSKEVSYLIRFEGNVTNETKIKFMTDGVLLKELQSDFLLTKYSVIILDEAHERSTYTDILIGLLSRIVPLRNKKGNPLKLIIMSATLRLADFTENKRLFKITPPVIKVEARQFPVTIHFNRRTPDDYLKEAFNKTVKIHTKLPDGAILVFVTGQLEVNRLVRKLRKSFPLHKNKQIEKTKTEIVGSGSESSDAEIDKRMHKSLRQKKNKKQVLPKINLDDYAMPGDDEENEDFDEENLSDEEDEIEDQVLSNTQPLWVLPLYSLLPSYKQAKVFEPPPEGCRLCVVSTNVAETSLTIPNVKYVVDSGKAKIKLYDKITGVSSYQVSWTSKASADQRAGRAGRTSPGHCYRLYSSAVYNDTFQQYSLPEIQQKPVDDLYLQMKCMNIDKVVNFPFPSPPDLLQLEMAEKRLEILGALKKNEVTPLGKAISQFPVLPRFGKMLALSHQHELLAYTICMVAALSVQEVLLETPIVVTDVEEAKKLRQKWILLRRQWAGYGNSLLLGDPLVLLKAVGAAEYANQDGKLDTFCSDNGLRQKAVMEIRKLRMQLTNEIKLNNRDIDVVVDPRLKPPSDVQARLLRQILLSGMGDQVAKKVEQNELKEDEDKIKYKYAYKAMDMEDPVYMHTNSVLKKSMPMFVIYQEIYETNKLYMRGVTAIEPEWLPIYVPHLCNLTEPLLDPEPRYDENNDKIYCTVNGTFGRQAWTLPPVEIEFPKTPDAYKWFARFLLEGKVFTKLQKYKGILLSPPSTMCKSWAKLQPRTDAILKALLSRQLHSKQSMEDIWKQHPQFLLHEYQKWLPESAHNEVSLIWPPLD